MKGNTRISIIAAVGPNRELGSNNRLVYTSKADMQHFKNTTTGHTVIMGLNTFKSLPHGALPNRTNIVISDVDEWLGDNVIIATSLEGAFSKIPENETDAFIIGGGMVYKQSVEHADRLMLSNFQTPVEDADVFFPEIDYDKDFELVKILPVYKEAEPNCFTELDYIYNEYVRKQPVMTAE